MDATQNRTAFPPPPKGGGFHAEDIVSGYLASVLRRYARGYPWIDPRDFEQEAALAQLEAAQTWRPGGEASMATYGNMAALYHVRAYCLRLNAVPHAPLAVLPALRTTRCGLEALGEGTDAPCGPDGLLDRLRAVRRLRHVLAELDDGSLAAEVLLHGRAPSEVATAQRIPVQRVYRATRRARKALRADEILNHYATP